MSSEETDQHGGGDQHDDFEAFEEKMDELNDGLLSAYAAGFQKALEVYDIHPDIETDLKSLKNHRGLSEDHYYFWDGRTKPLEFWLREQFGLDNGGEDSE